MRPTAELLELIGKGVQDEDRMKIVIGFTWKLVRSRHLASGDAVADPAHQLIQDAISDTVSGRRTWDPERVALYTHLCGVIKDRVLKRIRRRKTLKEGPLPAAEQGKLPPVESFEPALVDLDLWRKVLDRLLELAEEKGDEELQLVLMAYDDHCVTRAEIAEATGLTADQVTNVRKRLDRTLDQLPAQLRRDVNVRLGVKGDTK